MGTSKLLLALLLLGLGAGSARADMIELKNGRKITGKVLARGTSAVRIQVEGGVIDMPKSQIAEITELASPEEEYGERFQKTALDDPKAVEELAVWAQKAGLDERARNLRELAAGVRLEQRFSAAKEARDANALVRLAAWAKVEGHSLQVRRHVVEAARKLEPDSVAMRVALEELERDEEADLRAQGEARETGTSPSPRVSPRPKAPPADRLAERTRILDEREKALAERERLERARERQQLADREKTLRDEEERLRLERERLEKDESPQQQGYIILRRPRRGFRPPVDDEVPPPPPVQAPPQGQPGGRHNPLPPLPKLPPTPTAPRF